MDNIWSFLFQKQLQTFYKSERSFIIHNKLLPTALEAAKEVTFGKLRTSTRWGALCQGTSQRPEELSDSPPTLEKRDRPGSNQSPVADDLIHWTCVSKPLETPSWAGSRELPGGWAAQARKVGYPEGTQARPFPFPCLTHLSHWLSLSYIPYDKAVI